LCNWGLVASLRNATRPQAHLPFDPRHSSLRLPPQRPGCSLLAGIAAGAAAIAAADGSAVERTFGDFVPPLLLRSGPAFLTPAVAAGEWAVDVVQRRRGV